MIYRVEIEIEGYVSAESESEALGVARKHWHDLCGEPYNAGISARPVTSLARIPADWSESIPFGEADRTVAEIMGKP